ncbi:YdeI/OmpD-associated family protein [Candidatus Bathyarchaeota archaeon]|nr:YdeI/OmpD-associated family protein [Candidatus Bathyarchaeota archaeon]
MSEDNPKYFSSLEEWSKWLKDKCETADSIWIIIQKKSSYKPGVSYEEAVLEAVAYGWIDGKMKRLNNNEFMQRFSPRKNQSVWSLSNRKRAEKLIKENRMTLAGLKTVEDAKKNGRWEKAYSSNRGPTDVPEDLNLALIKNNKVKLYFDSFPQSARFIYIHWINEAKQQKTRIRRIKTVVDRSENNLKPGIDLRISKEK